jgi:hypothetical protein
MTRKLKLALAVFGVLALSAAVAVGAATPSVSTGEATGVTNNGATLHGTVNPGGEKTGWAFQWGVSTAYGHTTKGRSAGQGTRPQPVHVSLHGLLPGTPYHYRLVAISHLGIANGPDRTFRTKGNPPPTPTTGATASVSKNSATVTGLVDAHNQASTDWYLQYGTTTAYGVQSATQHVQPGTGPVPVSFTIQGLESGTIFHYRIVALNRGISEFGGDAQFMTFPSTKPKPKVTAKTKPGRDRKRPYTFTTSGHISHPSSMPSLYACTQSVRVRIFNGKRKIGQKTVPVLPDCTFSVGTLFKHLPKHHKKSVRLKVVVRYLGSGYLAQSSATGHVTEG